MNEKMKNGISLGGLVALLMLASCDSSLDGTDIPTDTHVALRVKSGIRTRATNAEWAKGDAVGIYMLTPKSGAVIGNVANRRYVAQTSGANVAFLPAAPEMTIFYPTDGSAVNFTAYYPQQTLTEDTYPLNVAHQNSLPAIDLMTATATGHSKTSPDVAFRFSHRLAKLELTIVPGTGLTAADLEGLKVEITGQRTAGTYRPLDDAFSIPPAAPSAVVLNTAADGTRAEAILLPNDIAGNAPLAGRQLVFTLKTHSGTFRWDIPDDKSFDSGHRYLYDITVNRTSLSVTSSIEDWGDGGSQSGSAE